MNGADFEAANKDVSAELFVPAQREEGAVSCVMARPSLSYWQDAWLRLRKNRVATLLPKIGRASCRERV